MVTDETIINQLSSTLIEKISQSIHEMGISAEIIKVFQRGPFVVIKVQLTEIDKMILGMILFYMIAQSIDLSKYIVLAAKGPEFASAFSSLLASLNVLGLADSVSIDDKILNQVRTGMITKFSQMIPEKMQESGLQVACTVASTEDQAEYFFETIQELERK